MFSLKIKNAQTFRRALGGLCKDLEHKTAAMRDIQTIGRIQPTNNESVANLSRLSLPLMGPMIKNGPTLEVTDQDVPPDDQNRSLEGEAPDAPPRNLAMIPEVDLLENSHDDHELDEGERLEINQPATDRPTKMATLGVEAIESDPVPAGVVPNCRRSRGDRNPEVLRAKRPSRPRKQHLRPSKGQVRRHVANRRIEERFSGSQAAKHERSNVFYQRRTRHRARRKHRRDGSRQATPTSKS